MPEKRTMERARRDKRQGKAATTQAGEFVREEMHHKKTGKHPVKNKKQAIAIGLSKARRAGVALKKPRKAKAATKKTAVSASRKTVKTTKTATTRRRRATTAAKKPKKTTRARTTTASTASKKKSASK